MDRHGAPALVRATQTTGGGGEVEFFALAQPGDMVRERSRMLVDWLQHDGRLSKLAYRHQATAYVGETLTCTGNFGVV